MDVLIDLNGDNRGLIPYHYLGSVSYFFRCCGFEVNWDRDERKVKLYSALAGKEIHFLPLPKCQFNELEMKLLKNIQSFLSSCKVNTLIKSENESLSEVDLQVKLSLLKQPSINKPEIEMFHSVGINQEKWIAFFQNEFDKAGAEFSVKGRLVEKEPAIIIKIKYPELSDDLFWANFGENYSLIITMGIFSYLQGETSSIPYSILPSEVFAEIFGTNLDEKQNIVQQAQSEKISVQKRKESRAFFDYHVFFNQNDRNKVKVLANFIFKNTGTENLKNPIICFRITPPGSITISGQILPPKAVEVFGVMSDSGIKGWKYMKEDWYKQIEDIGEIWISSIQQLNLKPNQTETIANLQFDIRNIEDYENIIVEAFVFYNEDELKTAAENRISISLENK